MILKMCWYRFMYAKITNSSFCIYLCFITVPPLEGFVMNRVLGDYLETLLYKIFVSIDEHTTVSEVR